MSEGEPAKVGRHDHDSDRAAGSIVTATSCTSSSRCRSSSGSRAGFPRSRVPTSPSHFARADQISRGVLVGTRFGATDSGGWIDAAIAQASAPYARLPFNPAAKVTRDGRRGFAADPLVGRACSCRGFATPSTTGPCSTCRRPRASGSAADIGLGVVDTLVLARVANGLACCALGVRRASAVRVWQAGDVLGAVLADDAVVVGLELARRTADRVGGADDRRRLARVDREPSGDADRADRRF